MGSIIPIATQPVMDVDMMEGINGDFGDAAGGMGMIQQPGADLSKRLHLLQGRLVRGVMHAAGLNPRAFRLVGYPDVQFKTSRL